MTPSLPHISSTSEGQFILEQEEFFAAQRDHSTAVTRSYRVNGYLKLHTIFCTINVSKATHSQFAPAGDLFQFALVPVDVAVTAAHVVVLLAAAVDGAVRPVQLVQTERNRNVENLQELCLIFWVGTCMALICNV